MCALFLPDTLDFILQQNEVGVELVNYVLFDLANDVFVVDLGLLMRGLGDDLTKLLAQNLVFARSYLLDVKIEMPALVVSHKVVLGGELLAAKLTHVCNLTSLLINHFWSLEYLLVILERSLLGLDLLSHLVDHPLVLLDFIFDSSCAIELFVVLGLNLTSDASSIVLVIEKILRSQLSELEKLDHVLVSQ